MATGRSSTAGSGSKQVPDGGIVHLSKVPVSVRKMHDKVAESNARTFQLPEV